jgi:hypothetical protein
MKIVKELEWVRRYVDIASHLIPKIKQLKKISSMKGNKYRWQHCHGLITYVDKRHFRITLYTTYHDMPSDQIKEYSTIDTLQYLAHELSHLEHWDHTPQHKQLECIIMGIFMTKLSEDGYVSEEYEEKDGKFYPRPKDEE